MNPKQRAVLGRAKALRRVMTDTDPALRLVIEIDGGQHSEAAEYDRRRDIWLSKLGYSVLRFWDNEVTENMEGVLERIADAVRDQAPSPPSPLPQAGEGVAK